MKFSVGDKIIIKRTGEEGIVTGFIGKDMLEVEIGGTQIPVYTDEVDHPYLKWFTEKNTKAKKSASASASQIPLEKAHQRPIRLPKGIYLSFMPVFRANELEDVVEQLKVFLINETSGSIRFSYEFKLLQQLDFRLSGTLHPFGNLYLHSVDYGDMNDQPRFHWQLEDANSDVSKMEEGMLRIKPAKLFDHINSVLLKNEPTFSYKLIEEFALKPKTVKPPAPEIISNTNKSSRPPRMNSFSELPKYEVDLHIEQLIQNHKGLSNAEIMHIQLQALQKYLHLAIVHRQEKMIVIHGLGSGALRDAVHRMLQQTAEVKSYRNEYLGKYGFGATEVIFFL